MSRLRIASLVLLLGVVSCRQTSGAPASLCTVGMAPSGTRVLVFSRTTGFRHESIAPAVVAIKAMGQRNGFQVEHTEDQSTFTDANLGRFAAVVFLHTTGDILGAPQQAALERYIRGGGGFAGVHAAADAEYDWPWYGELVGAWFKSHPAIQPATVRIENASHPSTKCLPSSWTRTDEWYDFRALPPAGVTILASLDESSYSGGNMGTPHPIVWYRRFDGGRSWYTEMGHTNESWADSAFVNHVAGGIVWAATR